MGYSMPNFDAFIIFLNQNRGEEREIKRIGERERNGLLYFFNGISNPYGLFNAEI